LLEDFVAGPHDDAGLCPGRVTDASALRQYVALAIIRKGGRITADDLAAVWLEKGSTGRFSSNERLVFEKLSSGLHPWDAGRGTHPCGAATKAIAPVGIVNVANPSQAYQDGYGIASLLQDAEERDAAATLTAGIAVSILPGATFEDVLSAMVELGSPVMRRAIRLTLDLAASSGTADSFTEAYCTQLADWRMPASPGTDRVVPDGFPLRAEFHSQSSLETIPVALALLHLCNQDANDSLLAAANFGRDSRTIASIAGSIAGALSGAIPIHRAWTDACEEANRDLFEELEGDPTANFYATAWRLVRALEEEQKTTQARFKLLNRLLRQ
jgi:ADP-ribosylglycohydrolase